MANPALDRVYLNYWTRKKLLAQRRPTFPVTRWWPTEALCPSDRIIVDAVSKCGSILDIGAGDLSMMRKIQSSGFNGKYDTVDPGKEFQYTYSSLEDVRGTYDAVVALDVLEHLPLKDGLDMLHQIRALLNPGGVLILQTPNARCIRFPLSWDMTHLQAYNAPDLWSYLSTMGFDVGGHRVVFSSGPVRGLSRLRELVSFYVITRIIGSDYADNLLMIGRKTG